MGSCEEMAKQIKLVQENYIQISSKIIFPKKNCCLEKRLPYIHCCQVNTIITVHICNI